MPDVNFTENFNRKIKEKWDRESEREDYKRKDRTYNSDDDYDYEDDMIWDNFGDW